MECDLVLEGGGVKGIGLVGAVAALRDHGYEVKRVAGTSAGAIVASLVAADVETSQMRDFMTMDYLKALDRRFGFLGNAVDLFTRKGMFSGRKLEARFREILQAHGVRTFADLRMHDPRLPDNKQNQYRLVVVAADVTSGRILRLPWDLPDYYGMDPDRLPVATAVHASMAAFLAFQPLPLTTSNGVTHLIGDGGLLSVFPISIFDRDDGNPPERPTFGVRLNRRTTPIEEVHRIKGLPSYLAAIVLTSTMFYDQISADDKEVGSRTVFVDSGDVWAFDLFISRAKQDELYDRGYAAMSEFLDGSNEQRAFDFADYVQRYRIPHYGLG